MSENAGRVAAVARDGSGYGPVVVFACFVGLILGFGPLFGSSFSVFVKPLGAEFGWSRSAVSLGISVSALVIALVSPSLGALADRVGPRILIVGSIILFAAAVAAMALLPPVYGLYLVMTGLVGLLGAGTTSLLYAPILAQWFDRRLGLSLGIAMTGIGVGTAIGPVLGQALVDAYGWRGAYLRLGLIVVVIGLPNALFLLREKGRRRGDRARRAAAPAVAAEPAGLTRTEALRTPLFWQTFVAILLMAIVAGGFSVHLVPLLTDRGVLAGTAARYLGLFGVAVLVSRLIAGVLLDRVRSGLVGMVNFAAPALGLAWIAAGASGPGLVVSVLLLGMAYGAESDLLAYIVRHEFGTRAYGAIFGLIFTAFNVGTLLGPLLMGASFDLLGSYAPALLVFALFSLLSAALISRAGRSTFGATGVGRAPPAEA